MRYAIVIEKAEGNFSAYVPDLPGCVATGATTEKAEAKIREAIEFHLNGLREDGLAIPQPSSRVEYVDVAANPALERAVASGLRALAMPSALRASAAAQRDR